MESHRMRRFVRLMRWLPSSPRCTVCRAPQAGFGCRMVRPFGFGPSRKNPRLCEQCFEKGPEGGMEMDVGVLFADVRGFTEMTERSGSHAATAMLNRFYESAVEVLTRHAIIDKLVGDQVMALYLPQLFDDEVAGHMLEDARRLVAVAPRDIDLGGGLGY